MIDKTSVDDLLDRLEQFPRAALALLPTPIHPLKNFGKSLGDLDLWMKRDDLSGLEGGGNKTRKLEYLVGDALSQGADMLVTVGAIQSNHTRQTAAAAAKSGLKCALLHCAWTKDAGPNYRKAGNVLISHLMGAELYIDETERPIEDQGPLDEFIAHLTEQGHIPYLIPGGASESVALTFARIGEFRLKVHSSEEVQCYTSDPIQLRIYHSDSVYSIGVSPNLYASALTDSLPD